MLVLEVLNVEAVLAAELLEPLHEFVLVFFGQFALTLEETFIIFGLLQVLFQTVDELLLLFAVLVVLLDLFLQPVSESLHLH